MTTAAWVYDFTALKIMFAISVSAQILESHRSAILDALCLHTSHCFGFFFNFVFWWFFFFLHVLSSPKI